MELASELERYREKLLDLSNRNPLLSYRKNTRTIQIVDELPDQIYSRLVDAGKAFRFAAAPDDEPAETKGKGKTKNTSLAAEQPVSTGEAIPTLLIQKDSTAPTPTPKSSTQTRMVLSKTADGEADTQDIKPGDEVRLEMPEESESDFQFSPNLPTSNPQVATGTSTAHQSDSLPASPSSQTTPQTSNADNSADTAAESVAEPASPALRSSRLRLSRKYSIELPEPHPEEEEPASRHEDDTLQTNVIDQEKLESQLKSIAQRANSAIEETGVNYLYLVLGTLQWTETDSSEKHYTAPLLLIPVQLERIFDSRSARYAYKLSWTEEDIQHNLCLEKKLEREFALRLPRPDEEQTPEQYFAAVRDAIRPRGRWKVCREAFLGFFSFHKLLMYLDANPANWDTKPESDLALANAIMCGGQASDAGTALYASEYKIDEDSTASKIPLIVDADSSQHSALCDIVKGKSLVIEGPPGTGKSQTITNAIAAAMHQGKSVLFVAEKLAALEVVQTKLEAAGLGDFCLAIHSDDASPRLVIESLRQRMDRSFPPPRQINLQQEQLEQGKQQLNSYLRLQQTPIGPHNETLNELQWKVVAARDAKVPALTEPAIVPEPKGLEFDNNRLELKTFQTMLEELKGPKQNPWWGFIADRVAPNEQESVLATLGELRAVGGRVKEILENCVHLLGSKARYWFNRAATERLAPLDLLDAAIREGTDIQDWQPLASAEQRTLAKRLVERVKSYHELQTAVSQFSFESVSFSPEAARQAEEFASKHLLPKFGQLTLREVRALRVGLEELGAATRDVAQAATELETIGCGSARNVTEFNRLSELLMLGQHPVLGEKAELPRSVFGRAGVEVFQSARKKAEELAADKDRTDRSFYQESIPEPNEILSLEKRMRPFVNSWLPWLSGDFRRAKQELFQFARPELGSGVNSWLRSLETLRAMNERRTAFESNPQYKELFGDRFAGMATDWEQLKLFILWINKIKESGVSYEQAVGLIESARKIGTRRQFIRDQLKRFLAEMKATDRLALLGLGPDDSQTISFQEVLSRSTKLTASLGQLETLLTSLRASESLSLRDLLEQLRTIHTWETAKRELGQTELWKPLGNLFQGPHTKVAGLQQALRLLDHLEAAEIPAGLDSAMSDGRSPLGIAKLLVGAMRNLVADKQQWQELRQRLAARGELAPDWLGLDQRLETDPGCQQQLEKILAAADDLPRWCTFRRAFAACTRNRLAQFLDRVMNGEVPPAQVDAAYDRAVQENAIGKFMLSQPQLRDFSRQKHEEVRRSFQELDRQLIQLNRQLVAHQLAQRDPPAGTTRGRVAEYTEMGLIRHEVQKQMRHCRIRDLLQRAGQSVQALKPCFMMSPLSVAQYLPPEGLQFDIVIMDEASQIKPEDALGTVLRARQLIVVGDPKQMPPTSFFERQDEEVDDETATQMDNTESILEVASKTFQPIRRLRWHYRSKHEHLIQFSNERFYDGDLIVFPSPGTDRGRLGLFLHKIENGFFRNRQNQEEAERIVEAIIEHVTNRPQESLGIGTLNQNQARLISDLLDARCEKDPLSRAAMEQFELQREHEPLFIKNLENLQGDERDVIFISFTYGKDPASGKVAKRFGPMNQEVGWRRFNVLITRARRRLEVFSSMTPLDVGGGPSMSRGVNAMRDFLEFCQTRQVPDRQIDTGRPPGSEFEEAVGKVISEFGLRYVPQVGVAGFFIDIGVLAPESESDFLLGIECDGASYHSSKSARDRDRLRQEIIESRGWKIHRIWSTDWYQNQKYEVQRLREAIAACACGTPVS
jgi:very-short-patch-repair endonuclease